MPCQLMKFSIRVEFLDTKLLVFTFPKAFRANTSELINAKTIIMVILVILIHGLSLTPHVYEFLCFFYMDLHSLRNKLVCINSNVFISSSLEFLKAVKEIKGNLFYYKQRYEGFFD